MLTLRLEHGDCREILPTLPEQSVQCVVTSPPYFGLRDYGTVTWDGGDPACDHIETRAARRDSRGGYHNSRNDRSGVTQPSTQATVMPYRDICGKCGAKRIDNQIGLEQTPDAYVAALVGVFREVRRVLRNDGVVFLNLGDSYAGTGAVAGEGWDGHGGVVGSRAQWAKGAGKGIGAKRHHPPAGLKPKDLIGIPWRVAFALQADGWYLRQDIIWAKQNPMPESVRDRCTKAHEYIFLLSKRERYFWDADAIAEAATPQKRTGMTGYLVPKHTGAVDQGIRTHGGPKSTLNGASGETRNRRSVWTVNTQPYAGAHFAVMPEALVEPCVLAGSRPGDLVLDPFAGSGTVCRVALRLGRSAIGIDLNGEYLDLAEERTNVAPLFVERPC